MLSLAHAGLRRLPPELAHTLTVRALAMGAGRSSAADSGPPATLFGKSVPNRIGLSGGADKNASALAGWARLGFGFVEAGTVTVAPRRGNPKPRVWRIGDESMVNAMGLPNLGIDAFCANLKAYRATEEGAARCVGASVASPDGKPGEMRTLAGRLASDVDFLTLNASCPNTEHEALDLGGIRGQIAEIAEAAPGVPLLVKLGPAGSLDVLDRMVDALMETGIAGFVACNTATNAMRGTLGPDAPRSWPTRSGTPIGGYSGPGLAETSLRMVRRIRDRVGRRATVIGVGGVQTPADLAGMIGAGADAVEIYTAVARRGVQALDTLRWADGRMREAAAPRA
jgi:dihydroorotate dehydrogenase